MYTGTENKFNIELIEEKIHITFYIVTSVSKDQVDLPPNGS